MPQFQAPKDERRMRVRGPRKSQFVTVTNLSRAWRNSPGTEDTQAEYGVNRQPNRTQRQQAKSDVHVLSRGQESHRVLLPSDGVFTILLCFYKILGAKEAASDKLH